MLRRDGAVDVRLPAVLAALLDAAAAAGGGGDPAELPSLPAALRDVLARRCRELLGSFATTAEEDEQLLARQSGGGGDAGGLMPALLQYRLGKKRLLQQWAAQ